MSLFSFLGATSTRIWRSVVSLAALKQKITMVFCVIFLLTCPPWNDSKWSLYRRKKRSEAAPKKVLPLWQEIEVTEAKKAAWCGCARRGRTGATAGSARLHTGGRWCTAKVADGSLLEELAVLQPVALKRRSRQTLQLNITSTISVPTMYHASSSFQPQHLERYLPVVRSLHICSKPLVHEEYTFLDKEIISCSTNDSVFLRVKWLFKGFFAIFCIISSKKQ